MLEKFLERSTIALPDLGFDLTVMYRCRQVNRVVQAGALEMQLIKVAEHSKRLKMALLKTGQIYLKIQYAAF